MKLLSHWKGGQRRGEGAVRAVTCTEFISDSAEVNGLAYVLCWPKGSFGFSRKSVRKNPNELFGQPSTFTTCMI